MTNIYEEMDKAAAAESPSAPAENIYAQMDAQASQTATPPPTPFEQALATRDAEIAAYQEEVQRRWLENQAKIKAFDAANPDNPFRTNPLIAEDTAEAPYLRHRRPPLPAREERSDMGSGFNAAFQSGLVEDEETKRRILAQTLFPNDPNGINRVGFDRQGQPVYVGDDKKLHKIASGTAAFGAQLLANSPEMLGAGIGSVAGPGTATLLATGLHGLKRAGAGLYYDEPQTIGGNIKSMVKEGAFTAAGEGLGRLMTAAGNRGRVVDFTPDDLAKAETVINDIKRKTGIDLDLAQASGDPRLIALRAFVARYPGPSAKLVKDFEIRQTEQLHEVTNRVLDTIAQANPAEVAGKAGINAAQATIDLARLQAMARVDPLYQAAYAKGFIVTDPNILSFFRHPEFRDAYRRGQTMARLEEKEAPILTVRRPVAPSGPMNVREVPEMRVRDVTGQAPPAKPPGVTRTPPPALTHEAPPPGTSLVPAREPAGEVAIPGMPGPKYVREKTPGGFYRMKPEYAEESFPVPDLRALDYTKRGLDAVIEELDRAGKYQLSRALKFQRRRFVRALDNIDIPEYKAARAAWKQELRETIEPLENGIVGVLARMPPTRAKAAARVFSDTDLTDSMVLQAKNAIQPNDPAAWDALTRAWIARQFTLSKRTTQTAQEVNAAGKFYQRLFGDDTRRAATIAMLDKPTANTLEEVMKAAGDMARTPTAGSNTFRDTETARIFEGLTGAGFKIWDAITSPRQALRTMAERRAVEESTLKFAQGILDPQKRDQLRIVLRMKPSTRRNVMLFNLLGAQTAKDYVYSAGSQGENSELIAGEPDALGQP